MVDRHAGAAQRRQQRQAAAGTAQRRPAGRGEQREQRHAEEQVALDHAQRAGHHVLRVLQVQRAGDHRQRDDGEQQIGRAGGGVRHGSPSRLN
jgi:hypothetical protein